MGKKMKNMTSRSKMLFACVALVLGFLAVGTNLSFSQDKSHIQSLRYRADRIYRYSKTSKPLPSRQIYALSVAMDFGDYEGAEKVIRELESRIY